MATTELSDPARAGLAIAEAELVLTAISLFVIVPFLYVASPAMMGGAPRNEEIMLLAAIGLATIGFVWMLRIYREAREPLRRT